MKKGKERIYEEFRDKWKVISMGLLCFLYFVLLFTSQLGMMARVLPPLPVSLFFLLGILVLAGQAVAWKLLKLFQPRWYLDFFSVLLFFCEWVLSLFVIVFFSWPFYFLADYLFKQSHGTY